MICTRRGVAAKHGLFLVPSQSLGSCMSSRSQTWMATCFAFSTTLRGRPAEYELRAHPRCSSVLTWTLGFVGGPPNYRLKLSSRLAALARVQSCSCALLQG